MGGVWFPFLFSFLPFGVGLLVFFGMARAQALMLLDCAFAIQDNDENSGRCSGWWRKGRRGCGVAVSDRLTEGTDTNKTAASHSASNNNNSQLAWKGGWGVTTYNLDTYGVGRGASRSRDDMKRMIEARFGRGGGTKQCRHH